MPVHVPFRVLEPATITLPAQPSSVGHCSDAAVAHLARGLGRSAVMDRFAQLSPIQARPGPRVCGARGASLQRLRLRPRTRTGPPWNRSPRRRFPPSAVVVVSDPQLAPAQTAKMSARPCSQGADVGHRPEVVAHGNGR